MIANTTKGNSIGRAVGYIMDEKKAEWYQQRNVGRNDKDIIIDDMQFTAAKSKRVQKPVYHISVSWHKDERPRKEQKLEVADGLLKHLNLDDHQAVIASHNDKDHPHIHIVINRVHPETGKVWEPYLYKENNAGKLVQDKNSYQRIEEYLRSTEKEFGFRVDEGKHAGQYEKQFDGSAPELWEIKHQQKSERIAEGMGVGDIDLRPVKERAKQLKDELYQAQSFRELDEALAQNGLWITADGQGASITDGSYKVKASSVSRGLSGPKLEARFGQNLKEYVTHREPPADTGKAEKQLRQWGDIYRQKVERQARTFTGRRVDVLSGQVRQLTQYGNEVSAAQRDLQARFTGAYSEGRAAYGQFRALADKQGYDTAVEALVSNPERFGQVTDRSGIVDAAHALRRIQQINHQYGNYLQQMSKSERKEKLSALNSKVQKWKQLRSSISSPVRSGVRESEGGRALQGSTAELINMSKVARKFINKPGKNPIHSGMNILHRVTAAMDSDGGQAAGSMLRGSSRHIKLATQIVSNPTKGSIKIIKNIIQSSARSISKAGREAGRSL